MSSHFCLSICFLDPVFHGRADGGEPEWPPSPLRAFQALVAAAARLRPDGWTSYARPALEWLERQPPPTLVTPAGVTASGYRLSVPPNVMDIVAKAWSRGVDTNIGDANPATHRTMKTVRPTRLVGGDSVCYLWPMADPIVDEVRRHVDALARIARSIVALGWGVDIVVGQADFMSDEEARVVPGQQWLPRMGAAGGGLRVPKQGTLDDLIRRHERFLERLGADNFTAPPPLSVYETVVYKRPTDRRIRPAATFSLLKPDASGFRVFDTARRGLIVAGMTRHAARLAAGSAGWDEPRIKAFVLGHSESQSAHEQMAVGQRRFCYLPLPTIETRSEGASLAVGGVRSVMVSSFAEDCDAEIAWARRAMSGHELLDEDKRQPVALLSSIPENDAVVRCYTQPAESWATVTPVVLPGYDDPAHYRRRLRRGASAEEQRQLLHRLDRRVDGLLRKAMMQSGVPRVLADQVELEWRKVGFWPGTDLAGRYGVPNHVKRFPTLHVRLRWRDEQGKPARVAGPLCLGSGRFCGLGLFAALRG